MRIPQPLPRFILWILVQVMDYVLDVIPRKQKDIILWNALFDWRNAERFEMFKKEEK